MSSQPVPPGEAASLSSADGFPQQRGAGSKLSGRELDVLRLVAEGMDNREIGEALRISAETVKKHISSILAKLQTGNRTQAAVYAVRRGLV